MPWACDTVAAMPDRETRAQAAPARLPNERFFEALPWRPVWTGLALALCFSGLLYWTVWLSGELATFRASGLSLFESRDARIGVLLILFGAYLPVARHQISLGARQDLGVLQRSRLWRGAEQDADAPDPLALDPRRCRLVGVLALLLVPLTAFSVDRDPHLYLEPGYWRPIAAWSWLAGAFACWHGGILVDSTLAYGRRFSRIARERIEIDLLDLDPLAPFGRQGLRYALPGLVLLSFYALNSADQGFGWAIGVVGSLSFLLALAGLALPMWGARQAIRREKQRELARVAAALRGVPDGLAGSPIARREPSPGLADLVAWRSLVSEVREWPLEASVGVRLLVYLALPLGSWLGGALVERMLDVAVG